MKHLKYGLLMAAVFYGTAALADFTPSQIGPGYVAPSFGQVVALLQNGHSQELVNVTDNTGTGMAVMDVVQSGSPAYPYLAVSHAQVGNNQFAVNLDYSYDLVNWVRVNTIDANFASQPSIRGFFDGSYLVAYEYNPGNRGAHVRLRYYPDLSSLVTNNPSVISDATITPGSQNDGTPSFHNINYGGGGFYQMQIELTHHVHYTRNQGYFEGGRDMEGYDTFNIAQGEAWNVNNNCMFLCWPLNQVINGQGVRGNIGGRDSFQIGGQQYWIVEGETNPNDFSSWNLYLIQDQGGNMNPQNVRLNFQNSLGSAQSLGNPKVSFVNLPNGQPAMIGTFFVFSQLPGGGTSNQAGEHMFIQPL